MSPVYRPVKIIPDKNHTPIESTLDDNNLPSLFSSRNDFVDFNTVITGTYQLGSQYNAGAGDDTVILPKTAAIATQSGFNGQIALDLGDGNDNVYGGGINSIVHGGNGMDFMFSGDGRERFYGDAGDDFIFAGKGRDYINGGAGNDYLSAGEHTTMVGGSGSDIFEISQPTYSATNAAIIMDYNAGEDQIKINVGNIANYDGTHLHDFFNLSNTAFGLTIQVDIDGANDSAVMQNAALLNGLYNTTSIESLLTSVRVLDNDHTSYTGGNNRDEVQYSGNSNITVHAGGGNDVINADSAKGNDVLYGDDGNDVIYAGSGSDVIFGGAGNDTIFADSTFPFAGNPGADTINGGQGSDYIALGGFAGTQADNHADTVIISANDLGTGVDTITAFETGIDKLKITDLIDFNGDMSQYVQFNSTAKGFDLQIDIDGNGTHYGWQTAAHLEGVFTANATPNLSDIVIS